jgi:hypothetical protein
MRDGIPRAEECERSQERRENNEQHGHAVDADIVTDVQTADPRYVLLELERWVVAIKLEKQVKRNGKRDRRRQHAGEFDRIDPFFWSEQ